MLKLAMQLLEGIEGDGLLLKSLAEGIQKPACFVRWKADSSGGAITEETKDFFHRGPQGIPLEELLFRDAVLASFVPCD